jgi:Na+/H+ antiporter NhaD/arsenite permease-like protein
MIVFGLIYLLTIFLSVTGIIALSTTALLGAFLIAGFGVTYGVFTYEEAASFINMRIIALVVGVMIVVAVAEKSGVFRFAALYAIKISGGKPKRLFITMNVTAALVSMFLGDPTAMLLIAAAITTITKRLGYDPIPYFISAAIMVNLGGTSTLIGSISNMIIGVEAGFSFKEFLSYLAPVEIMLWGLTMVPLYFIFKSRLGVQKTLPSYDPWNSIKEKKNLYRSAFLLILMVILFIILEEIGLEPEAVALGCAVLSLVISGIDPAEIFKGLDWETVFFLAGFFFQVKGMEKTGIYAIAAQEIFRLTAANPLKASFLTLWSSGLISTLISNTAVSLTFIPIIKGLTLFDPKILWSALILGTNLGGVTTPLSGSVAVMTMGAMKREGISIGFAEFTKIGIVTTLIQLSFASLYLTLRFGLLR